MCIMYIDEEGTILEYLQVYNKKILLPIGLCVWYNDYYYENFITVRKIQTMVAMMKTKHTNNYNICTNMLQSARCLSPRNTNMERIQTHFMLQALSIPSKENGSKLTFHPTTTDPCTSLNTDANAIQNKHMIPYFITNHNHNKCRPTIRSKRQLQLVRTPSW